MPFFRMVIPRSPRTSNRMQFQPFTSHGPAGEPSHVVPSVTSTLPMLMSHCIASAFTRSCTTAAASSPSKLCVMSTIDCLSWLIMKKPRGIWSAVFSSSGTSVSGSPIKTIVRFRRLLNRNLFQEAKVESRRKQLPRFRTWITSEGAILFNNGITGDSNSQRILHSKSGRKLNDFAIEARRTCQRCCRSLCAASNSKRTKP
mmetsp:Transcript_134611/g.319079  ORF Transcript_134611/g.319079 Transcript_134611/m.319079 type:complete len:201 (+) Transcript_134611:352-954(+)